MDDKALFIKTKDEGTAENLKSVGFDLLEYTKNFSPL